MGQSSMIFGDELWPAESQLVQFDLVDRVRPKPLRCVGNFRAIRKLAREVGSWFLRLYTGGTMPTLSLDNPVVELELQQLDLSHADLRIMDSQTQSRLVMSIETEGQLLPVVVVRQEHRSVLIDGFARVRALRRLGEDTVQALVLACSEADAMLFCYRQQQGRRPTAIEGSHCR
jgi:hypothetical protein